METVVIYALGVLGGVFTLYLLGIMVAPYMPNDVKNDHFECGLPPSSEVPMKANFSYFIFAIAFIIFDMAGLFFSLFVFSIEKENESNKDLVAQEMEQAVNNGVVFLQGAEPGDAFTYAMVFGFLLFLAITISMKEYRNAKSS